MTKKLYWENDSTEAEIEVLHCEPQGEAGYAVRLNATPFHPQGGGQPADVGWIGVAEVFRVTLANGEIVHHTSEAVEPGTTIARVDVGRRQRHSRLHSAGHLIGHALEPLAWRPVKAHHWPGEARVVFKSAGDGAKPLDVATMQGHCEALIALDLPRRVQLDDSQFRYVGFGDLPPYGCGGTHVNSTARLQGLQVLSVSLKKGQLIVQYDIQ
ncbi:alanyl-tRNA editing protein [Pectobacterium cacticida]|uniref:alanyl-tRNA editing protein n=1 Tax=Pectobacterium cacticida TaxID=69221 RepID=UPI003986FB16